MSSNHSHDVWNRSSCFKNQLWQKAEVHSKKRANYNVKKIYALEKKYEKIKLVLRNREKWKQEKNQQGKHEKRTKTTWEIAKMATATEHWHNDNILHIILKLSRVANAEICSS